MTSKETKLVRAFLDLEENLVLHRCSPKLLGKARIAIEDKLSSLPIHTDGIQCRAPLFFTLTAGEWWPCSAGIVNEDGVTKNRLQYRIDYENGSSESGVAQPLSWAHATVDGDVNYHWLDGKEN